MKKEVVMFRLEYNKLMKMDFSRLQERSSNREENSTLKLLEFAKSLFLDPSHAETTEIIGVSPKSFSSIHNILKNTPETILAGSGVEITMQKFGPEGDSVRYGCNVRVYSSCYKMCTVDIEFFDTKHAKSEVPKDSFLLGKLELIHPRRGQITIPRAFMIFGRNIVKEGWLQYLNNPPELLRRYCQKIKESKESLGFEKLVNCFSACMRRPSVDMKGLAVDMKGLAILSEVASRASAAECDTGKGNPTATYSP